VAAAHGQAPDVAVVGAGAIGLSVAHSLLQDGARVAVYEQGPVPNPHASSVDASRLIRHTYGSKRGYAALVDDAYAAWEQLWADLGERLYADTGTLMLARPGAAWAHDSAATLDALGKPCPRLDPDDAAARFPLLDLSGIEAAYLVPSGGVLAADRIVAALARRVVELGGTLQERTRVAALDPESGTLSLADGRSIAADRIVLAAGPWTGRLWPELAGDLTPSRQLVCTAQVPDDLAAAWADMPMVLDIGADSGVYAVPPVHGAPLKLGDHSFSLTGDPDREREPGDAELQALYLRARRQLAAPERYRRLAGRTCFYTVAAEERFRHCRRGRAHVLAACSGHGFKFAPLIGARVADLLAGRVREAAFQAWLGGAGVSPAGAPP
jgi:glycine/D-amino acid oxidase-like deaminating enzyme